MTDVANYFGTFYILRAQEHLQNSLKTTRMFSDANSFRFKEHLEHMDFSDVLATLRPNEAYGEFIKLYKHVFKTCFPLRARKLIIKY